MPIVINGFELTDAMVEAELPRHQAADNPLQAATHELIFRRLLLDKGAALGLAGDSDEALIDAVIEREVRTPQADEATCRTYYRQHPEAFRVGDLAEARHILFQVTPSVDLARLRLLAQDVLTEVRAHPARFEDLARRYSNCPSAEVGGQLGQLQRGDTVPEFDQLIFRLQDGELADFVLETRFGLHIVQVMRRIEGNVVPFEQVADSIRHYLEAQSSRRALNQYLQCLVGEADIQGIELSGAETPLVQ